MLCLTIDGISVTAQPGDSVLSAAISAGIEIPALCDDPRLAPSGACRLCVVQITGTPRPATACTTPAVDGMTLTTRTPQLHDLRKTLLTMLARDYSAEASTERPELLFHSLLAEYGIQATGLSDPTKIDSSHPIIHLDLNACVKCWRCVRICEEVQGQFTWRIDGRGDNSRIVPDSGSTLAASSCVSCGACVDTCPTTALSDFTSAVEEAPTDWTRTTCPYCGVGCEMLISSSNGRIIGVGAPHDAPVNHGHLCAKGRYGHGFVQAKDRITTPMLRGPDGRWVAASWDEAIHVVNTGFRRVIDRHGPEAVGMLGSARATNEENYLTQKFARAVLATNNVDCCARVCHAPSAAGLKAMFGTGAATSSFDDIEIARTIMVCGSNTTEAHPIVGARIKQAALGGANLIIIDPRQIELARYADIHLQPHPGTNVAVLNSLAAAVLDEDLADVKFVAQRVDSFEEFKEFAKAYAPERMAALTGLDAGMVRVAARLYAGDRPAISFHGLGLTEHIQGTDAVMCLVNLALLTGNVGRPGTGVNPLRGQNNVQGAAQMGCEPHHLPGMTALLEGKGLVEKIWGTSIPTKPGLDAMEMLDAAAIGQLGALWVIGWDIALTQPHASAVDRALASLDVLVVQDLFLTETARRFGTVFLPVTSSFEKNGTFMNSERRIQRVRAAVTPPREAKSDAEILCLAASAFGAAEQFTYPNAEAVWEEIRRVWPDGAGITYQRLEREGGLQWPCPDENHPGTRLLHEETFSNHEVRTTLRLIGFCPSVEVPNEAYPLTLITGRELMSFNAGTMTSRSRIAPLDGVTNLEISIIDATRFRVSDGASVRVRSRYGEVLLRCRVSSQVETGVVFATFNDPTVPINRVTGPGRDSVTNTPEYKMTAVSVEPATS